MEVRVEVAIRPEYSDPGADRLLRALELSDAELRAKARWARLLEVFWFDLPIERGRVISAIEEIFFDPVLKWLFTGELLPAASANRGNIEDLTVYAPERPGVFWAVEKRFRPGVTDRKAKTALEAFQIVTGEKLEGARAASGALLIVEGKELTESALGRFARSIYANELIESWSLFAGDDLKSNARFRSESIRFSLPRNFSIPTRGAQRLTETFPLLSISSEERAQLSESKLWGLNKNELDRIAFYYSDSHTKDTRSKLGLNEPTDVEMEIFAQTWSEHCKHKIFGAEVTFDKPSEAPPWNPSAPQIPVQVQSLFKTTIVQTTEELQRPWLLSVFSDNAGLVDWDADHALAIKVETHNSPSALDPYGGALTGIVGVNRDILGVGRGAKPIFNIDVFCLAPIDLKKELPAKLLHPRRILEGVRHGVEDGGNQSGIPTVAGALVFDERYLAKPLIYCGTGGLIPRRICDEPSEKKQILPGDRVVMLGGRIGKDGIHGATFSSMALTDQAPSGVVQLGDAFIQKRMTDFLLKARDLGLYRTLTDNGAGGLSSSVGELATLSGGVRFDVGLAKTKYPGLKPFERVISESQERMTLAVPPEKLQAFETLANHFEVEWSDLGEFNASGLLEVLFEGKTVAALDLHFLHQGCPKLELPAKTDYTRTQVPECSAGDFSREGREDLVALLGRPGIASKEWLIRQYDHEVQGGSVLKPIVTSKGTSPNDGGALKPLYQRQSGVAVGLGIQPRLSDWDPYTMGQMAVDEAIRNAIASGSDYGSEKEVLALVDNFCWPDPIRNPVRMGDLVRTCFGMRSAALGLKAPLVSGKDSMKNNFSGQWGEQNVELEVVPTLLMTAIGKISDVRLIQSAEFKAAGDSILWVRASDPRVLGSEWLKMREENGVNHVSAMMDIALTLPEPRFKEAHGLYSWLSAIRKDEERGRWIRSLHDVSDGGLLVAVVESLFARNLGARLEFPENLDPFETAFGEGFHGFVISVPPSAEAAFLEELQGQGIQADRVGELLREPALSVKWKEQHFEIPVVELQAAWEKKGYWQ